jgi:hypothetical protein
MAAWVLHPRVTAAALGAGTLDVDLVPPVRAGQSVQAELVDLQGAIRYVSCLDPPGAEAASLSFPLAGAPAGNWRVRVRVDGAESPLPGAPEVALP